MTADAPTPPEPSTLPALEDCGFVRVPADGPLWMTCERCGKSDRFWLDDAVRCRCGAVYSHAIRPDGERFPLDDLTWVPFEKGPRSLADLEWDPKRIALIAGILAGLVGLAVWFFFR